MSNPPFPRCTCGPRRVPGQHLGGCPAGAAHAELGYRVLPGSEVVAPKPLRRAALYMERSER